MNSFQSNFPDASAFRGYSSRFLAVGISLIILGLLAVFFSTFTTILSVIVLGAIIFVGGVIGLIDTITFWRVKGHHGFLLNLVMSILYVVVGIMLISRPVSGAMSLTLLVGTFYLILGLFRLFYSMISQPPNWKWAFFNGLVSLILGLFILAGWPVASLFIIGLFIGIDLLVAGWAYLMMSWATKE